MDSDLPSQTGFAHPCDNGHPADHLPASSSLLIKRTQPDLSRSIRCRQSTSGKDKQTNKTVSRGTSEDRNRILRQERGLMEKGNTLFILHLRADWSRQERGGGALSVGFARGRYTSAYLSIYFSFRALSQALFVYRVVESLQAHNDKLQISSCILFLRTKRCRKRQRARVRTKLQQSASSSTAVDRENVGRFSNWCLDQCQGQRMYSYEWISG